MSRASEQAGVFANHIPTTFDPKNPVVVFIIQAGIIIILCRLLGWPLSRIRQPRVIAEVVAGILLGPTAMGRVPGFTDHIFPAASMPVLNNAANIGLIFYLFLVGLEVDLRLMLANWRIAASVGLAGMILPFGLGCAIAYGLYHQFRDDEGITPIAFGTYMLFVGVAMAITAFPVLCRILTELKLLQNQVGVVTLTAGVSNDVVGWILLALCVALVNAGSGLTALWVLLTAVGFVLFLVYGVRPVFMWTLRRTGSIDNGPTQSMVALTLLLVLASSFFTAIIGIHAIFGAFVIGLICPHEGGFAIKLVEKIEDLITVFFLPLYFTLSGLSTDIGLLDSGITWAYVVGVIAIAFTGKIVGGTLAARGNGLLWRESFTIGTLMSCKGLVELIVLNIGLQAQILSTRTFTIFVVMALVTTFATTPIVSFLFPPAYQKKLIAWRRGEIDWDGKPLKPDGASDDQGAKGTEDGPGNEIPKLLVALRLDNLPSIFTFIDLLGGEKTTSAAEKIHPAKQGTADETADDGKEGIKLHKRPLQVHGLRLYSVGERLSSIMQDSEVEEYSARDPVVNAFHTFGQLHNVAVSGSIQLSVEDSLADILSTRAADTRSDMILLPWSDTGSASEIVNNPNPGFLETRSNPFNHPNYNNFVSQLLSSAPCATAVLINKGFGALRRDEPHNALKRLPSIRSLRSETAAATTTTTAPLQNRSHHIFFPFFGGWDDHVALRFVLRLAQNPNVTATIVQVHRPDREGAALDSSASSLKDGRGAEGATATMVQAESSTSNNNKDGGAIMTTVTELSEEEDQAFFSASRDGLSEDMRARVVFSSEGGGENVQEVLARAKEEVKGGKKNAGDLLVLGRRAGKGIVFTGEADGNDGEDGGAAAAVSGTLGATAAAMLGRGIKGSVLVVQAGPRKRG